MSRESPHIVSLSQDVASLWESCLNWLWGCAIFPFHFQTPTMTQTSNNSLFRNKFLHVLYVSSVLFGVFLNVMSRFKGWSSIIDDASWTCVEFFLQKLNFGNKNKNKKINCDIVYEFIRILFMSDYVTSWSVVFQRTTIMCQQL